MRSDILKDKRVTGCGCNVYFDDLTDKMFGRLKAVSPTQKRANNGSVVWLCVCTCGKQKEVSAGDLKDLRTTSCGCLALEHKKRVGVILGQKTKDVCVHGTNIRNLTMKIKKTNSSGVKGVTWDKEREKWKATIRFQGKSYFLGRYNNLQDAIKARKVAEEKIFGEFLEWYEQHKKKLK